ncbi:fatty acyl-CoA reductase wat-like [Vespa velutina]|uniref:fatty acyl-CoA reductase wat-like n=1 Tax=Vespa velutina TaxID=202808 RepID=UPI001FB41433|nr:fatty acyl-CoA reductase wat-like [Vespa velutina]XP_047370194.1 fatty acyl-CoA reductase wat-like [Vespa velutina]
MGKMLIEKLLRGCPGINCIYILIRRKKDKSVPKRMEEIVENSSFVHVSTAYANCLQNQIEEKFYNPPMDADKCIDLMEYMDEKLLDDITPHLLGVWPNTYVYTKSIAENILKRHAGVMPIGIFRPGIVLPTYIEPTQGWTDNMNGLVGITAGAAMGIIRTNFCDESVNVNIIPGDLTTNVLIVSAWDIANNRRSTEEIPIYNYTSTDYPITYKVFTELAMKNIGLLPTNEATWYLTFRNIKYQSIYLHVFSTYTTGYYNRYDFLMFRLLKMYKKIYTLSNIFNYFTSSKLNFTNLLKVKRTVK